MTHRVVYTDHTFDELDIERSVLAPLDATVVDGEKSDEPVKSLVADADAVLVMFEAIDETTIDSLRDCRIISRTGIGLDNVDVDTATENGVYVTNVPDYCIQEVSDHAMALILALERNLLEYREQVSGGGWDVAMGRDMCRLSEQTVGLIAFGNIARAIHRKAAAFGLEVLVYDPYLDPQEIREEGAQPVGDLHDLLAESDIVSVHAPLTPETKGLIGADEFAVMPDSGLLINVARGGIVDEDAIADAVRDGEIAGVGLDVLEEEPPPPDHPLRDMNRVIVTPHAAWNSAESVRELRRKAATNVLQALRGDVPDYLVNSELVD